MRGGERKGHPWPGSSVTRGMASVLRGQQTSLPGMKNGGRLLGGR